MLNKVGKLLRSKRGAALIISMLLLIILTVLGLAAVKTSTTEIEISANERRSACSFYAADAGLQVALRQLSRFNTSPIPPTEIGNNASFRIGPITTVGSVSIPGGFDYTLFRFQVTGICGDPNDPMASRKELDIKFRSLGSERGRGEWGPTGYNVGL